MTNKIKVLCGMSGGVDSSVAAALLQQQGYEVVGIFMKFWSEQSENREELNKCCSVEAYMSAKRVAQILDIPLYTLNFETEFKEKIVDNFLDSYQNGFTPNPCVRCNQFIKFGLFIEKAKEYDTQFVATGHYARTKRLNDKVQLLKGKDLNKDQSYFLHKLTQEQLQQVLFPVGDYTKPEIRKLAEEFKLPVAQKQDSQELCFVGDKEHYGFLNRHLKLKPGDIVTVQGEKVGEHKGLPLYTIGQRKGIEIGGTGPYYVVSLDFKNNRLIVSKDEQDLLQTVLFCEEISWISSVEPELPLKCQARVRYRQEESDVVVSKENDKYKIEFKNPQRAITVGQSCVLYQEEEVLGGGVISLVSPY